MKNSRMDIMDAIWTYLMKGLALLLVFLAPIQAALIAVSVLVIIDLISGIWAAKKEKQEITSYKLRRTVAKTLAYQMSIIVAHIMETYLLQGIPIIKTVSALVAITEGKSVMENLHRITGINFWSAIIDKLHGGTLDKRND